MISGDACSSKLHYLKNQKIKKNLTSFWWMQHITLTIQNKFIKELTELENTKH